MAHFVNLLPNRSNGNNRSSSSLPSHKPETNKSFQFSSESRVDTPTGSHQFTIKNYSLTKGLGIGKYIHSTAFQVGEVDWQIRCYLEGFNEETSDYISVFLGHKSKSANYKARVNYSLSLLDRITGAARYERKAQSAIFKPGFINGWKCFIKRGEFEASECLREDSITIICNVTIVKEPQTYPSRVPVTVKPATLRERLGNLLSTEYGADVKFVVDGQSFLAHKNVLVARSPVFRAQFSGVTKDAKEQSSIIVTDIKAPVFEAILLYIYTNAVPEIDILTVTGMTQHLLVAADRFGLDKFRIDYEKKLCEGLDASNVCTTLALAEQHSLCNLKTACLEYLSTDDALVSSMATDGFIHLVQSCPSIAKEISYKIIATRNPKFN